MNISNIVKCIKSNKYMCFLTLTASDIEAEVDL